MKKAKKIPWMYYPRMEAGIVRFVAFSKIFLKFSANFKDVFRAMLDV